ncbi:hypothetical protein B0T12DRAFT_482850 [Alternaria alternata]|nr:hypothetical protein B0T12DRAFT_482850 [Alternaria alternata]
MPSSANAEANLEELLSLSRHGAQREPRSTKIRSLTDEDIAQVISIGTKREFTREGLEKILFIVLDTAAQEGGITSATPTDRAGDVKVKLEECTDDLGSIALSVEELASSAGSSPTASAALEHCIKRDPGTWEAFDTTVKRARKNNDVSAIFDVQSAGSVSPTAPGHILFGPTVPEHLLYVDPTPWHPEFRESCAGMSKDPDYAAFFTKDELGFYIPKEMLSTQETNDGLEPLPKMPLELSVQIRRKIGADFIQGWKCIERYGDMILFQARNFGTSSHCLSDFTIRRKRGPSTRVQSRGDVWSACDFCIDTRRLCLRMIKVNHHGTEKVVFPLPPQLRIGKHWTEMGFWVRDATESAGRETATDT